MLEQLRLERETLLGIQTNPHCHHHNGDEIKEFIERHYQKKNIVDKVSLNLLLDLFYSLSFLLTILTQAEV